jgi:hypothetical protein
MICIIFPYFTSCLQFVEQKETKFPEILIEGNFSLSPSREGKNDVSCFDLDKGINTGNETADICMGQGPQTKSPIALGIVNGASKFLSKSKLDIDTCLKSLNSYTNTNIPDFPIWNICVQTNQNNISIIKYLEDESWQFQTWQLFPN